MTTPITAGSVDRVGDWIQTFTGQAFWPLDPAADEIRIEDIAHALANQCRFGGHTRAFYSVAQHSVMVSLLVPAGHALQALMHDASEAFMVDVPRPIKYLMPTYREAEEKLMAAISRRFGFAWPMSAETERADLQMLCTEAHQLLVNGPRAEWKLDWRPHVRDFRIDPVAPAVAEKLFLHRFGEIRK